MVYFPGPIGTTSLRELVFGLRRVLELAAAAISMEDMTVKL